MSRPSRTLHLPGHPNVWAHWQDLHDERPGTVKWAAFRAWLRFPQALPRACKVAHDPVERTAGQYRWTECGRCGRRPFVPQPPSLPGDVRPPMPVPGEVLDAAVQHGNAEWRSSDNGELEVQVMAGPNATFKGQGIEWHVGNSFGGHVHLGRFLWLSARLRGTALNHRLTRRIEESNRRRESWGLSYYEDRNWSLALDGSRLIWNVGLPGGHWSRQMPRWRHGSINLRDLVFGKGTLERTVEHVEQVELQLPEGAYSALVKVERFVRKRPRARSKTMWGYDITPEPYIPVPGKGENSWDCGDDGVWAMSGGYRGPVDLGSLTYYREVVAAGVSALVGSALRDRMRYAGSMDWRPSGYHPVANPDGPREGMAEDVPLPEVG